MIDCTNKTSDKLNYFEFDLDLTENDSKDENYILCGRLLKFMSLIYPKDYKDSHITKIKNSVDGIGVGIFYKNGENKLHEFIGYRCYYNNFKCSCKHLKSRLISSIISYYSYTDCRIKNPTQLMMTMDLMGI